MLHFLLSVICDDECYSYSIMFSESQSLYISQSVKRVSQRLLSNEAQQYFSVTDNSYLKLRYFGILLIKVSIIFSNLV